MLRRYQPCRSCRFTSLSWTWISGPSQINKAIWSLISKSATRLAISKTKAKKPRDQLYKIFSEELTHRISTSCNSCRVNSSKKQCKSWRTFLQKYTPQVWTWTSRIIWVKTLPWDCRGLFSSKDLTNRPSIEWLRVHNTLSWKIMKLLTPNTKPINIKWIIIHCSNWAIRKR